ncbi:MAG: Ldh family oxidoreductase [Methylacidiphilales bacterium]|nr:Ldh family oxidoreductase [Candidatus Methylacidiphilales bacterium]MDW8350081.1 Ldh family oxidoreductase [Verrucomicrobiae bacterium]
MVRLPHSQIQAWIERALVAAQVLPDHAKIIAQALVQTSLWGIDSHGIARLPHYLNRLTRRSINPRPVFQFERTGPATGRFNGDHGHGIVICFEASRHAVNLAREVGAGVVGIFHSSHCGAIGLYSRDIAKKGLIGIVFTHSDSFVVPHGGKKAFFGTNPISIALPRPEPLEPVCLDLATSIVPWNRIMNARRENTPVPLGLGVDENGEETTDPHRIVALKPVGEHKGYALAFVIDALCGPLNGMPFGPHIPKMYGDLDQYRYLGSLIIAIDPNRFIGLAHFASTVDRMCQEIKSENPSILFPGEPEIRNAQQRSTEGIPVEDALISELDAWATRLALPTFSTLCHTPVL